ncbi:hypothetical protein ACIBD9_19865 [Micromonospora sp. NPDC050784]|uniref:hypothetical protein n=1 Tax=Micromonospora sp. NPDC050784 TaxID=3364281 RepID=UPI00378FA67C
MDRWPLVNVGALPHPAVAAAAATFAADAVVLKPPASAAALTVTTTAAAVASNPRMGLRLVMKGLPPLGTNW